MLEYSSVSVFSSTGKGSCVEGRCGRYSVDEHPPYISCFLLISIVCIQLGQLLVSYTEYRGFYILESD